MNALLKNACTIPGLLGLVILSACQSGGPVDGIKLSSSVEPLPQMVSIARSMQKCWFKSANATFRPYRLANETNSYAGRPRLLLVPRNKPTGLPSLVVQGEKQNGATVIQAFGPLLTSNAGQAISADLRNWISGGSACATKS